MMPGGLDPISELQRLTVSLRGGFEQKDGCLVFHFTGQLDAYSEKQFMEYVGDVLKANKLPSVLDLSKIDFLDSSGLGALVQLAKQCTDAKRSFLLVGNTRVKQTIKLVRLEQFLHLVEDLPTALNQLAA
ncbi:MAG: STAS domain-containing protein [Synechococcus sp.]|jgi:anti-anti-sigma factor|uniref:STAS domain-containing protein n=1 Tax=unclassified Synechococcus TaxID=2626047 RepID=UPI00120B068A|nr:MULTISPECIES: STAS domain-containing protein [unclassified Synechococcus]MBA4736524.1 STAS domain-containing protein [Synechococcus sp.]MCB4388580.1 STAS domain-containing protein [Synechococcus sp. MU1617]MDO6351590.1 STAS domain-containing protein [Synechococcus sp. YX-04-1]RZN98526.1 MAG: anti-sigma factor antagonist [Synechococcus sp. MED-G134]|tara:strand:+ start:800 stop:1189 length:390 start_codon:yes stop_codon:yes gene_type:complete